MPGHRRHRISSWTEIPGALVEATMEGLFRLSMLLLVVVGLGLLLFGGFNTARRHTVPYLRRIVEGVGSPRQDARYDRVERPGSFTGGSETDIPEFGRRAGVDCVMVNSDAADEEHPEGR